ncbi:MAG: hypothetical protein J6Y72_12450 [Bacteroidales bacterium]|nr:hypothetical protein [Bacteroidales bacterium]
MEEKKEEIEETSINCIDSLRQYDGVKLEFDSKHLIAFDRNATNEHRFIVDIIGAKDDQGRQLCFLIDTGCVFDIVFEPALKYLNATKLDLNTDVTIKMFSGEEHEGQKSLYEIDFMLNSGLNYKIQALTANQEPVPVGDNKVYVGLLSFEFLVENELVIFPHFGFMAKMLPPEENEEDNNKK